MAQNKQKTIASVASKPKLRIIWAVVTLVFGIVLFLLFTIARRVDEVSPEVLNSTHGCVSNTLLCTVTPQASAATPALMTPTPLNEQTLSSYEGSLVVVVLALEDIPRGVEIQPHMVGLTYFPTEFLPLGTFNDLNAVVGRIARADISPQQLVLSRHIISGPFTQSAADLGRVGSADLGRVGSDAGYVPPPPSLTLSSQTMYFEDYGTNAFVEAATDNLSTFAMDVDTGSYTLTRSYLLDYNQLPPPEAIRSEEFINFFPTDYAQPAGDNAFAIHMDAAQSPFTDDNNLLLRVGIQGRTIANENRDPALLIFVIDVSGSMEQTNRLHLAKETLILLTGELREDDRIGIVVYANEARVVLEPTPASEQNRIINAINSLRTEGSTFAEAGLRLGYDMALANMRDGENARVILISDGVANVGATGPDAILETIAHGTQQGITLSTIGVGMGNYNDVLMEQLANDGNGNYYYVDNRREAERVFVHNLTSTLQVIGYDAKIQVEFNPDAVHSYRLIGYENRDIADEDFRNNTVDAGEVGAGHTVTALYEIVLNPQAQPDATLATAMIRYEDADTREVVEINQPFVLSNTYVSFDDAPADFRLLAAVAEFSEILRDSPYADSTNQDVLAVLETLSTNHPDIGELVQMVTSAESLATE